MPDLTMTRGARYAAVGLLLLTLLTGGANLVATYLQVQAVRHTVQAVGHASEAQCKFDYDLSGVPISINPATGQASLLGVKIVADSRAAWRGLGCPGRLARPSPSFVKWARFYHLPPD
ncbi:MAG TPA: hypothetical protein VGS19_29160 [Streptosporangiaceae bacterium]|nr:hypothetical protein [Streptosporangiaceae bacterium]